jgi:hypothetical protein
MKQVQLHGGRGGPGQHVVVLEESRDVTLDRVAQGTQVYGSGGVVFLQLMVHGGIEGVQEGQKGRLGGSSH